MEGTRRALLIGCSKYSTGIADLPGAANDVQRFEALLTKEFHFTDVRSLAGVRDENRPTASAIAAEFQELISRTKPGDQVFILLSGHGTQFAVPDRQTDLLDPANPEPDGFDEVFLAADFANGANFIRDDQFGQWLDQLRSKPADVWIVFDCCFSGTMMRGATASTESTTRGLRPIDAGVSQATIDRAIQRAESVNFGQHGTNPPLSVRTSASRTGGTLVAFYACQAFETAKEVFRPETFPRSVDNRSGLLSYHLLRSLRQCGEQISYRDLSRMVVSGIRAELGSDGPTPLFDGDIDQRVLGLDQWPETGLYLEKVDEQWRVSGGKLAGLADQTIMSVHPLARPDSEKIAGYVRVIKATTSDAEVIPVAYEDVPEIVLDDQTLPLRCKVVSGATVNPTSLGILSLNPDDEETLNRIVSEIQQAIPDRVQVVSSTDAECLLTLVTPMQAQERFGYTTPESGYLLLERRSARAADPGISQDTNEWQALSFMNDSEYQNPDAVKARVIADLQRVRTWDMLWKVSSAFGENSSSGTRTRLSLRVINTAEGDGLSAELSAVSPGTKLEIHLENRRYEPVWYTVFFLNGRYGIEYVKSGTIRARESIGEASASVVVDRMQINADTVGVEGYIAIGVPLDGNRAEPDFKFLEQPGVGEPGSRSVMKVPTKTTLFEKVLIEAAQGGNTVRSGVSSDQAEVTSFSWVTATPKR